MSVGELTQRDRFVNTLLLVLLVFLGASGIVVLYGAWFPWLFELHRMAGFALIALLPWKGWTVYRSLSRGMQRTFDRSFVIFVSLVFAHFLLIIIILGIIWMWRIGPYSSLGQTLIAWHWILGLLALPFLVFHAWRRWPGPQKQDFISRRSFLKLVGVAGAGLVFGGLASRLGDAQATEQRPRRFTGSRGFGLFSGNEYPIFGESTAVLDPQKWRLRITGAVRSPLVLTYDQILAIPPQFMNAVIDCTSGWYSIQDWQGIPLAELLALAGAKEGVAGVRLVSATAYNQSFPIDEAREILLATHVSGEALAPRHGFPLRAVVPGRRGWFWVKWLSRIDILEDLAQVAAGVISSPRQVLRQWR
jgi:hypothetical protein